MKRMISFDSAHDLQAVEEEPAEEQEGDEDHRCDAQTNLHIRGHAGQEVACRQRRHSGAASIS